MINKGHVIAEGTPKQLREKTGTGNLRDAFFALVEGGAEDEL
jgi:ABC-type Na+ transport system ATPase subunit NatA